MALNEYFDKWNVVTNSSIRRDDAISERTQRDFKAKMKDPQLAYMWEVDVLGGDSIDVKVFAMSSGIPAQMMDTIKRYYRGKAYYYSSRDSSPRVFRMTLWDDQELTAYKYFSKWVQLQSSYEEGKKVKPAEYMRGVKLTLLDTTGEKKTMEVNLSGVSISEISEVSLSYDVSAPITFDVLFNFQERKIT